MIAGSAWRVSVGATADRAGRDLLVEELPGGTLYHGSCWQDIITGAYGFRPLVLTLEDSSGELGGVLPLILVEGRLTGRRLVSLPYTNAAGPLCRPGVDGAPLLAAAVELAAEERCRYLEVRGQPGMQAPRGADLERLDYYGTFLLDLDPDLERTRSRFDKRVRRGIARASKCGVQVRFGTDPADLRAFYRLNLLTRRKHGVPPQPLAFFERLWAELRPRGGIEVLLAEYDRRIVAGVVLLPFKQCVTYAYGASDTRYLHCAPNHALFDAAITWAARQGYRTFDFGRTAPDNAGLMEFKRQWGPAFLPLPYYYWPEKDGFVSEEEGGWKHRLFTSGWRRLPIPVTSLLGPILYRELA